jgi:archaellum component FlaC
MYNLSIDKQFQTLKFMIQVTTADIREIKELIERVDTRLIEVEKKVDKLDGRFDKLDNRLWVFAMLILGSALTTIVKITAFPNA